MTAIANAREFNGSSDNITFTIGNVAGSWGGATFAAIIKPQVGSGETGQVIRAAGSALLFCEHPEDAFYAWDHAVGSSMGNDPYIQDEWNLIGFSKPAGTSTVRLHRYRYSDQSWVHSNGEAGATPQLGSSTTMLRLGSGSTTEFYDGLIAVAGIWKADDLSDAEFETLIDDIASWEALSPTALWLLNQTSVATSVEDRVGNSDQSSISGTTVASVGDLAFDVGGGLTLDDVLPDADVTTTGWTSTPLYSKVNDESDATVIQATAA